MGLLRLPGLSVPFLSHLLASLHRLGAILGANLGISGAGPYYYYPLLLLQLPPITDTTNTTTPMSGVFLPTWCQPSGTSTNRVAALSHQARFTLGNSSYKSLVVVVVSSS